MCCLRKRPPQSGIGHEDINHTAAVPVALFVSVLQTSLLTGDIIHVAAVLTMKFDQYFIISRKDITPQA
jgi:hypothetical protein